MPGGIVCSKSATLRRALRCCCFIAAKVDVKPISQIFIFLLGNVSGFTMFVRPMDNTDTNNMGEIMTDTDKRHCGGGPQSPAKSGQRGLDLAQSMDRGMSVNSGYEADEWSGLPGFSSLCMSWPAVGDLSRRVAVVAGRHGEKARAVGRAFTHPPAAWQRQRAAGGGVWGGRERFGILPAIT